MCFSIAGQGWAINFNFHKTEPKCFGKTQIIIPTLSNSATKKCLSDLLLYKLNHIKKQY